jgi:hypothetical protein
LLKRTDARHRLTWACEPLVIPAVPTISPSHAKVRSTTDLTVLDASGKAVSGAAVTIVDQNNTRVFSGTTAAGGKLSGIPIATTTYSVAAGADNSKPVQKSSSLFTIRASSGALTGSLSTIISKNQNLTVRLK